MVMKKLLQINVSANFGSTGRIAEMIGRVARNKGYDSYIAYGRDYRPSELKCYKIGNSLSIKWHYLMSRYLDMQGLGSVIATKRLVREIKRINPSIIHLHNIHGHYINYRILFNYLKTTDVPIVWTLHDCWPFTGHCSHFAFINCDKWKTGCSKCPGLSVYPNCVFLDHSSRNYALKKELFASVADRLTLVPVSNWLEQLVKESFLKKANVVTIHNGVDTNAFCIQEQSYKGLPDGKKIVLAVTGVWDEKKGLRDVIELSKIMSDKYQLVMVGLTQKQVSLLPENIIGITRTDSLSQLAALYSTADVYINPTWEDNFPTTNLEALACGTPVITYKTGGSVEAVTPETGSVVNQGDVKALYTEIERLCSMDRDDLRKYCRERAVKHFEMSDRYTDYLNLYESLLNNR